jgi:hypothetical protein
MITQQHRRTSIASLVLFLGATAFWTSTALAQTPTDPPAEATPPTGDTPAETKTPPKPPAVGVTAPAYDIKLRELEEQVVGLKEKVFKSKTRLMLLKEQILHNVIAESRAIIVHNNDMGPAFTLSEVLYYLDNDKIYYQDNRDGVLDDKTEFEIFNGNVLPGNHLVSVELVYRGNGTLFSYIDGYTFKIRSSYTFYATKGRISRLKVVGYERGGITTDLEQKPYVRYEVQQFRYNRENLDKAKGGELEAGDSDK